MIQKKNQMLVLAFLVLCSCAAPVQHATASGKPEVTIAAAPKAIRSALENGMVNSGYTIAKDSNEVLVFEKEVTENLGASLIYGSQANPYPTARARFYLIPEGKRTRVVGDLSVISNGGSPYERVHALNNGVDSDTVQKMLYRLKNKFEK
ncbi:MAG TPA: hypothetical protein VHB73_01145 [Alphaproteobacteria bacterium]|nr:hypothetical protein [Alphaproteobacteria bacterium]